MYRFLVLIIALALCISGCVPAEGCDLFSFFSGGNTASSSCGSSYNSGCDSYTPVNSSCGSYTTSSRCCPQTTSRACAPAIQSPGACDQVAPMPELQIPAAPIQEPLPHDHEPNPQMTPVTVPDDLIMPDLIMPEFLSPGQATIRLQVPSKAIVIINGYRTKKSGNNRAYVSSHMKPGFNYTYKIEVITATERKTGTLTLQVGNTKHFAYHQFYPRTNTALAQR